MKFDYREMFIELMDKVVGGSAKESPIAAEVTKALDEEKRMALFVVLEPDTVDLHGDTYSADEVEKACNNFNTHCNTANLFHQVVTEEATIVQSYTVMQPMVLDSGVEVKKGTWVQWWYFPETETGEVIWKSVKSGDINGVSIGAMALCEDLTV